MQELRITEEEAKLLSGLFEYIPDDTQFTLHESLVLFELEKKLVRLGWRGYYADQPTRMARFKRLKAKHSEAILVDDGHLAVVGDFEVINMNK